MRFNDLLLPDKRFQITTSVCLPNTVLGSSKPEVQWKKPKLNASSSSYPATMATLLLLLSLDSRVALLLMQLVAWSKGSL